MSCVHSATSCTSLLCCPRRLPGERMDLWITRHNYRAPRPYWGFWQFNSSNGESLAESADAAEAVAAAGAVLFMGGNATASAFVIERWPGLANRSFQVRVARCSRQGRPHPPQIAHDVKHAIRPRVAVKQHLQTTLAPCKPVTWC